jgi:hypothetical protein
MNQDDCTHSDEERCIFRTWIVDLVRKAVDMGYGLVDVFQFLEYEVTCFDITPFQEVFRRVFEHVPEIEARCFYGYP